MQRAAVAVLVLAVCAAAAVPAVVTAQDGGPQPLQVTPSGFDRTVFAIQPFANGTAEWTFRYSRVLDNESQVETFRIFADRFENETTPLYDGFVDRSGALAAAGTRATNRDMRATNFAREARIDRLGQTRGVVALSFHWTNFAVVDGDRVHVGDVFEGGIYIGPDQQLVIERGPDLAFQEAAPEGYQTSGSTLAESESITWSGERQFADGNPRVVLAPPGADDPSGLMDFVFAGIGVLGVVALVAVAVWKSSAFELGGGGGGRPTPVEPSDVEPGVADEEFLTDRDRVTALLEEHGGRMKQVNIVEETDWSKSKVSMLLSEMEEEGEITKLRVGRENIVSLAGEEPDAAGSPFEDEE